VPLRVKFTVKANAVSPTRVKRNVPGSGPVSDAAASMACTVTIGVG